MFDCREVLEDDELDLIFKKVTAVRALEDLVLMRYSSGNQTIPFGGDYWECPTGHVWVPRSSMKPTIPSLWTVEDCTGDSRAVAYYWLADPRKRVQNVPTSREVIEMLFSSDKGNLIVALTDNNKFTRTVAQYRLMELSGVELVGIKEE